MTLLAVQCRPAAACARKSPLRVHCKETRQDKTRLVRCVLFCSSFSSLLFACLLVCSCWLRVCFSSFSPSDSPMHSSNMSSLTLLAVVGISCSALFVLLVFLVLVLASLFVCYCLFPSIYSPTHLYTQKEQQVAIMHPFPPFTSRTALHVSTTAPRAGHSYAKHTARPSRAQFYTHIPSFSSPSTHMHNANRPLRPYHQNEARFLRHSAFGCCAEHALRSADYHHSGFGQAHDCQAGGSRDLVAGDGVL